MRPRISMTGRVRLSVRNAFASRLSRSREIKDSQKSNPESLSLSTDQPTDRPTGGLSIIKMEDGARRQKEEEGARRKV